MDHDTFYFKLLDNREHLAVNARVFTCRDISVEISNLRATSDDTTCGSLPK